MQHLPCKALLVAAALALSAAAAAHGAIDAVDTLDFRRAPRDTLPWGTLAKVGLRREDGRFVPQFLPPLRALQGKRVTLYGYMVPQPGHTLQRRFLLSSRPLLCDHCSALGPQDLVEVVVDKSIRASEQPLAVRGTLNLLTDSPDGLLFRLEHAQGR